MEILNKKTKTRKKILLSVAMLIVMVLVPYRASAKTLAQEYPTYIVQAGDSLGTIAQSFGVSVDEIQALNKLSDPNAISIGQQLLIPGLEGITGLLTSSTIEYGQSLTSLSRQYQTSREHLITLNHLISPSETIVGLDFIIPVQDDRETLNPLLAVSPEGTTIESAILSGSSPWLIIKNNQIQGNWDVIPGESLYGSAETAEILSPVQGIQQISINNLPIIQGETLEIKIATELPAQITGQFNDSTFTFFTEDNENYYSFSGVHALGEPGIFPLKITADYSNGIQQSFDQLVLLTEGGYGNEWVNVPDDYLDQDAIAEEDAYLDPILSQATPVRYWDGYFSYPVDEPCIGSLFGQRRDYNNGNYFFYHTGLDFTVCAQNLNIYAPAAGKVVVAEELYVKGNAIVVDHGWGVYSIYAHLAEFRVQVGDMVQPGDLIGIIGNTGRSAGPHLHFEIDILGTPVNPLTWLEQAFP